MFWRTPRWGRQEGIFDTITGGGDRPFCPREGNKSSGQCLTHTHSRPTKTPASQEQNYRCRVKSPFVSLLVCMPSQDLQVNTGNSRVWRRESPLPSNLSYRCRYACLVRICTWTFPVVSLKESQLQQSSPSQHLLSCQPTVSSQNRQHLTDSNALTEFSRLSYSWWYVCLVRICKWTFSAVSLKESLLHQSSPSQPCHASHSRPQWLNRSTGRISFWWVKSCFVLYTQHMPSLDFPIENSVVLTKETQLHPAPTLTAARKNHFFFFS